MKVLGLSGSLRAGSHNSKLLRAAGDLLPEEAELVEFDGLKLIPPFDEDDEHTRPDTVQALFDAIASADAVLVATPEYNHSLPGQFKNALDWMSRPPEPPFDGKVVAIMGASPGPVGTARVQYDLRKVLVFMNAFTVNKPEVFIANCASKFDAQGNLTDEASAKFIGDLLVSLQNLKTRVG